MKSAVDSSVLLAIRGREKGYGGWAKALQAATEDGQLCVCPVVFAELSPCALWGYLRRYFPRLRLLAPE